MSENLAEKKNQLRHQYRIKRDALTPEYCREASEIICGHIQSWKIFQESSVIFTYMAMNGEVDLISLLSNYPHKQWVIPRIQPHNRMTLHPYHPQKLIRHKFGMLEPDPELPQISSDQVDLVLVPGLIFDKHGWRLGYGGGFYDTFLANCPNLLTLGITYQAFLLTGIPHMAHDMPVGALVTEEGILDLSSRLEN